MEAIAKTKYLKGSPRKARLVIDLIRGQRVSHALSILRFTNKRAADPISKTLQSAIANATYQAERENIAIDPDDLWVKSCFVDMGPTKNRRRMRPAPQGRAYREQRHYCHITIEVTSGEKPKTEKELKAEAAKAKSADRPKKAKAPAAKAATKNAKAEEAETAAADVPETPEVEAAVTETPAAENLEAAGTEADANIADAKDASTTEEAESNDTKPVDEAQEQAGEETEKQ
ncbi:MAG TPA: 50S ribosomal protein L22 [Pyrinomonadaceae bacterium]|nr:50S ribosomal protein L22 [Pyrinomonadaceae bacterium]